MKNAYKKLLILQVDTSYSNTFTFDDLGMSQVEHKSSLCHQFWITSCC